MLERAARVSSVNRRKASSPYRALRQLLERFIVPELGHERLERLL